jgi:hypothetical protein
MLARTMMGDAYQPRPAALDLLYADGSRKLGARHQAIIDSVVSRSSDPRVGELTVRLAYRLASASGAVVAARSRDCDRRGRRRRATASSP